MDLIPYITWNDEWKINVKYVNYEDVVQFLDDSQTSIPSLIVDGQRLHELAEYYKMEYKATNDDPYIFMRARSGSSDFEKVKQVYNDSMYALGSLLGALSGKMGLGGIAFSTATLPADIALDIASGESLTQAAVSQGLSTLGSIAVGVAVAAIAPAVLPVVAVGVFGIIGGYVTKTWLNKDIDWLFDYFITAKNAPRPVDPLALDLDGDGLISTISADAGIMFDHKGNGVRQGSGWVNSNDGFLVYDRNGDGIVNSGSELFGADTADYSGNSTAGMTGFRALAQEDTNGDGVVNQLDDNWNSFKVWRDLNQDGISQANELFTLEGLGITEFRLDVENTSSTTDGGTISGLGTYVKDDGTIGTTVQLDLDSNPFYSDFIHSVEISDHLSEYPDMGGSGAVRSLVEAAAWQANGGRLELPEGEQAMTDTSIQNILNQFINSTTSTMYLL